MVASWFKIGIDAGFETRIKSNGNLKMIIKLEHKFVKRCHDLNGLLNGCVKLSTYCNRLEKQAQKFPDRYDPFKYVGDGFEMFTEMLIKSNECNGQIGIADYHPIQESDNGVDGLGVALDGKPATVQVKYRGNTAQLLTADKDNLNSFIAESGMYDLTLRDNDTRHFLIVTTAAGLNMYTDAEKFHSKVRCLGNEQLRQLVDNNVHFWNSFRQSLGIV